MAHAKISRSTKSNQQTEVKQDTLTLGQHLSAVLNSPNLPVGLHTGIWDCLGDIPTADLMDEPEFLDKLLKVGQEMETEQKTGKGPSTAPIAEPQKSDQLARRASGTVTTSTRLAISQTRSSGLETPSKRRGARLMRGSW